MDFQEFKKRRERFYRLLGQNSIAILGAAKESIRSNDVHYPYRQSSDFYYLTGFTEPNALSVFIPGRKKGEYILFISESDFQKELWFGKKINQRKARELYKAEQVFPISDAAILLPDLILGKDHLYFDIGRDISFDRQVINWLNMARRKVRFSMNVPDDFSHIGKILHEMRIKKSPYEIALLKKSADISVSAHIRAIKSIRPNKYEYQIAAELYAEYIGQGGNLAFQPIVACGKNACTLHYELNNAKLKDGELLLIDAGAEYEYYASDVTRTVPVGKKFSLEQRAIYQAVLDTELAVINKVRPGLPWNILQETSERVISEKLLALGILKGSLKKVLAEKTVKKFYMHRIGHWLGLDTHDVGKYALNGKPRILEPGMVFTVEPGIYIPAKSKGVDKKWWNIGVRIEDDILVTKNGHEVLTDRIPKAIADIETLRRRAFE